MGPPRPPDGLLVVVPTRDRPAHLDECLIALKGSVRPEDEVLVVDSASREHTTAEVARTHGVSYLRCDLPGASRARNAGWQAARTPIVAFVDDDVRVQPGWAGAMASAFDDPSIAFVTGRVGVPERQRGIQRPVAVKDDDDAHQLDRETPAPLGASANLAVRRDALELIGGFDEAMGGGARFQAAEDLDLFDRLLGAGLVGRYDPGAASHHEQWRSRRTLLRLDLRYGIGAGARIAKLVRVDRSRAARAAREAFVVDGLRPLGVGLRNRHEFEIATTAARLLGTVFGIAWGAVTPLRAGRFR